ncbi:NF-X1-type zinc finger protein NFXL1 [Diabrotica virgifera virgifera]|uniref:NF-X1-type domain-containing protein n=1 Tax=Diabrotica virgifera virgifera TaxID=50390 RepID=A0ABM5KN79_DIAVI|nr:NF-X1-type zinc finger protein NFXL1 [Diabrotica virgifera virgifera]
MHSQPKPKNPWNQNVQNQPKKNKNKNLPTPGEVKFKEAQAKLQASVKKHVKEYESSSDEEELESATLIDSILKNYRTGNGEEESIEKTQTFLQETFLSGAATCLICISRVRKEDQIWTCVNCYGYFHLMCVQRWSKDTVTQLKHAAQEQIIVKQQKLCWCCPKCRHEYDPRDIPMKYLCFCTKTENPKYDPYIAPHSCGQICRKPLKPDCGHHCLLLCHPGPCPPCPVTVNVSCYCGRQQPRTQRCSKKEWSCNNVCDKPLECNKHNCPNPCHPGECQPCPKKSIQKCICKAQQKLRECASPVWQCDKVCNKPLECGHHKCEEICHEGVCDMCPLAKLRTCPCGKTTYQLPCTQETPTCPDTCDKVLDCGIHGCNLKCHREKCGVCLETVEKSCRCGQHTKEVQCYKPYLCEVKCKQMKDCNKHPCNRKCCDGNCPPCEKPCGKTLNCGNHKCSSVCHRGPCYPCSETDIVTCKCGATKISVPCGRKHKTKPPKCPKLCLTPPDCHHEKRDSHRCHFGDCPPCRQICNKIHNKCSHSCPVTCHSAVLVKIEGQKASMPWEQVKPQVVRRELPCPDCVVKMPVTCLGEHETSDWPCYMSKPSSCHRQCGRLLDCGNHRCTWLCHTVKDAPDNIKAGANCEKCENSCSKQRPEGCTHACPKPCHPGDCPPCKTMIRIKCYCGLNQPYVTCADWLNEEKKEELQTCGNQCPKNYECGHRCKSNCHPGPCPNADQCKKKVKVSCKCKRIKKEFSCETVRKNEAVVPCDEVCEAKKEENRKLRQAAEEQKRIEEEAKNKKELEKYQKMFEGKKKSKERRRYDDEVEDSFIKKYLYVILAVLFLVISGVVYFALL